MSNAIRRLQRQPKGDGTRSESPTISAEAGINELAPAALGYSTAPSKVGDDPLAKVVAAFDDLDAALRRAMQSGELLDYGQFVLEELERIRADLEACRLLINDGCTANRRSA